MRAVIFLLAASSIFLCFAAFGSYNASSFRALVTAVTAILFWGCLIAGYVLLFIISKHRKEYEKRAPRDKRRREAAKKNRPGIITFFSHPAAVIADIAMIGLFIVIMAFMFIPGIPQSLTIILIAFLVFAIQMHGVLNGVNFKYIEIQAKNQ